MIRKIFAVILVVLTIFYLVLRVHKAEKQMNLFIELSNNKESLKPNVKGSILLSGYANRLENGDIIVYIYNNSADQSSCLVQLGNLSVDEDTSIDGKDELYLSINDILGCETYRVLCYSDPTRAGHTIPQTLRFKSPLPETLNHKSVKSIHLKLMAGKTASADDMECISLDLPLHDFMKESR